MQNPEPDRPPLDYRHCFDSPSGRLDISCRDLDAWPFPSPPPDGVISLDAALNRFTQIPTQATRLPGLRRLLLFGNRIVKIPATIEGLPHLEALDLGENPVRHISEDVCQLRHLRRLSVYGGCLETIPAQLGRLQDLQRLTLGNELAALPPSIGLCRRLLRLSLSHNRLNSLPPTLGALDNLIDLRVDNNRLAGWPATFRGLRSLRWLHADGNPLRRLPWFALELPAMRGISCCDFLVSPDEAGRFTEACVERGIVIRWNRSLCTSETYDPELGDEDSLETD